MLEMSANNPEQINDATMPLLKHLEELRRVIIVSLIAIGIASVVAFYFVDHLLEILTRPLRPLGLKPVIFSVTEGLFFKFKVALLGGLVFAAPVVIWEIWRFILPALYPNEKKYILKIVPISIFLFVGGIVFGYYTLLPVMIYVLIKMAGGFTPIINVSQYLSFILSFLIPFGFIFEYPVVVYFLTKIGIVRPEWLVNKRKYAIVVIFILAAALTPSPDPINQTIMAAPILILYEVGIVVSKLVSRKKETLEVADEGV